MRSVGGGDHRELREASLAFEQNLGQTDPRVAFLARGSGFQAFITPTAAVYRFPGAVLRMELAGASGTPSIKHRRRCCKSACPLAARSQDGAGDRDDICI